VSVGFGDRRTVSADRSDSRGFSSLLAELPLLPRAPLELQWDQPVRIGDEFEVVKDLRGMVAGRVMRIRLDGSTG
jgi:hypothetical protein